MTTFRERLLEAIRMREISRAELSRRSGVSEALLSSYVKGSYKANQYTLVKLANTLNVPVAWLMGADVPLGNQALDGDTARIVGKFLADRNALQRDLKLEIIKDIVQIDFTDEQLKTFSAFLKSLK